MKVIINGGRDYQQQPGDFDLLDRLHERFRFSAVISGGATGADELGEQWALFASVPVEQYPADWYPGGVLDRSAGPRRNQQMVDVADMLVAFPGGSGTADCIRRARAKGIRVIKLHEHVEFAVDVTRKHIMESEPKEPCRCAVSTAIKATYPHIVCVTCNADDVEVETHDKRFIVLRPGRGYREFLQAFDQGKAVPTTLRFRVTEEGEHDWKFGNLGP